MGLAAARVFERKCLATAAITRLPDFFTPLKRPSTIENRAKLPRLGTADISPRRQMQLSYDLPAGEYAMLDFNRDMKTGRAETLEGMYAVVTLQ